MNLEQCYSDCPDIEADLEGDESMEDEMGEDPNNDENSLQTVEDGGQVPPTNRKAHTGPVDKYLLQIRSDITEKDKKGELLARIRAGNGWIHPENPFMSLHDKLHKKNRVPQPADFYQKDLFVWDPKDHFQISVHCPECGKEGSNKSWAKKPRRVFALDRIYYILSREYSVAIVPRTVIRTGCLQVQQ